MTSNVKLPETQSPEMLVIVTDPLPAPLGNEGAAQASMADALVRASGVQPTVANPAPVPTE
jgi:hypothetical protein